MSSEEAPVPKKAKTEAKSEESEGKEDSKANPKMEVETTLDNNREEVLKILEGTSKTSDHDNVCFLLPESHSGLVLKALQQAKMAFHDWRLVADEIVPLAWLPQLPSCFAHLVRSLPDKIPPEHKTEYDLVHWLIHGDAGGFVKKYLVLEFYDCKDGPHDGYCGITVVEITQKEHMVLKDHANKLMDKSESGGDNVHLCDVYVWDRQTFLSKYQGRKPDVIADDELVQEFQKDVNDQEWDSDEWARGYSSCNVQWMKY